MRELRVIELIGVRCQARRSCMKFLGGIGYIGTKSLYVVEFGVGRVAMIEVIRMRRKKSRGMICFILFDKEIGSVCSLPCLQSSRRSKKINQDFAQDVFNHSVKMQTQILKLLPDM
jgi:hypothetical protein